MQRLVHLAMRLDKTHETSLQGVIGSIRRDAYEATLTEMATAAKCTERKGLLSNEDVLTALDDSSKVDAQSVSNTYNFDLAISIIATSVTNPKASRFICAKSLKTWDSSRALWKSRQIAMNSVLSARLEAQNEFFRQNPSLAESGYAILVGPNPASGAICQGLINRGRVPIEVAQSNPSPFHLNCPHTWMYFFTKLGRKPIRDARCTGLWLGT